MRLLCIFVAFGGLKRLRGGGGAEAFDDAVAEGAGVVFDGGLVEGQETAVAHDDAAVDDDGFDVGGFGGVDQIGIDVVERDLIQRVAIDDQSPRVFRFPESRSLSRDETPARRGWWPTRTPAAPRSLSDRR